MKISEVKAALGSCSSPFGGLTINQHRAAGSCWVCGLNALTACYSDAGRAETRISGICEPCFDDTMRDPAYDEENEAAAEAANEVAMLAAEPVVDFGAVEVAVDARGVHDKTVLVVLGDIEARLSHDAACKLLAMLTSAVLTNTVKA